MHIDIVSKKPTHWWKATKPVFFHNWKLQGSNKVAASMHSLVQPQHFHTVSKVAKNEKWSVQMMLLQLVCDSFMIWAATICWLLNFLHCQMFIDNACVVHSTEDLWKQIDPVEWKEFPALNLSFLRSFCLANLAGGIDQTECWSTSTKLPMQQNQALSWQVLKKFKDVFWGTFLEQCQDPWLFVTKSGTRILCFFSFTFWLHLHLLGTNILTACPRVSFKCMSQWEIFEWEKNMVGPCKNWLEQGHSPWPIKMETDCWTPWFPKVPLFWKSTLSVGLVVLRQKNCWALNSVEFTSCFPSVVCLHHLVMGLHIRGLGLEVPSPILSPITSTKESTRTDPFCESDPTNVPTWRMQNKNKIPTR